MLSLFDCNLDEKKESETCPGQGLLPLKRSHLLHLNSTISLILKKLSIMIKVRASLEINSYLLCKRISMEIFMKLNIILFMRQL